MKMPVLVKICGITNVEDAAAAAEFGADFVGLNFYPGSPRCITEAQARLIMQALLPRVTPVALFVNESWERMAELSARLGIDTIQVHGDKQEPCPLHDRHWIPAVSVRDEASVAEAFRNLFILPQILHQPLLQ